MNGSPRPKRSLGQNFLVDRGALRRIADALDPQPGEALVEIGPGRGALTAELLARAGRIAAVELDRVLVSELQRRYNPQSLILIEADILAVDLPSILEALGASSDSRLVIAGNLPYNISKPIANKLIRERAHIDRAVLMFQKEVALRLTADPGSRDYGPMSILAREAFTIRRLFDLRSGAFRPRPRVDSSVTLWNRRTDRELSLELETALRECLSVCFARRRQTLRNNLRAGLGDRAKVEALLERCELDGALRADALPPEAFLGLAGSWNSSGT